jgi:hypothetical protein
MTMDDRIQRVLDGELSRDELSPAERTALGEAEAMIGAVLRSVPARELPDLGAAVLQRLAPQPAPAIPRGAVSASGRRIRELVSWLWTPRQVSMRFRPAYALLVLALLVPAARTAQLQLSAPAVTGPAQVLVQFRFDAPQARAVMLAGDFTRWKPTYTMTRSEPGIWTVVVPLETGVHDYAFIVDGERWTPDPMAPAVSDGFGGLNSRLAVLSPDQRRPL